MSSFPQPGDEVLAGFTDRDLTVPVAVPRTALTQVVVDNSRTGDGDPVFSVVGVTAAGQRIILNQLDSAEAQAAYIQASAQAWLAQPATTVTLTGPPAPATAAAGGLVPTPLLTVPTDPATPPVVLYEVPAGQRMEIKSAACCNQPGPVAGTVALTVWLVPAGQAPGPACQMVAGLPITPGPAPTAWPVLVGTVLGPGDAITATLTGPPGAALSVGLSVVSV